MAKRFGKFKGITKRESALSVIDGGQINGVDLEKTLAFGAGYDPAGLTTTAKADGDCDSGFTIADNTIIDAGWDAGAASAITLPAATLNNYVVWRQTGKADGDAVNLVISCASGDFFAGDQILSTGTNLAVNNEITAATDNTLTIAINTATNNGWGEVGSSIVFFCKTAGFWQVKLHSVSLGSGAAGSVNTTAV